MSLLTYAENYMQNNKKQAAGPVYKEKYSLNNKNYFQVLKMQLMKL